MPRNVARSSLLCCVWAFGAGCGGQVTAPQGQVTLAALQFTQNSVMVGEPLVLIAQPAGGDVRTPQPLVVRASSGAQEQVWVSPWDSLSDAELTAAIATWGDEVFVGVKESGADRGVDERGQSITSAATVERMTQWLEDQGVTIIWQSVLLPVFVGRMPLPIEQELVARIRQHANVDYLEPVVTGEFATVTETSGSAAPLVAVVGTSAGSGAGLRVRVGDTVTAEYRQPDGSVLSATAVIRE